MAQQFSHVAVWKGLQLGHRQVLLQLQLCLWSLCSRTGNWTWLAGLKATTQNGQQKTEGFDTGGMPTETPENANFCQLGKVNANVKLMPTVASYFSACQHAKWSSRQTARSTTFDRIRAQTHWQSHEGTSYPSSRTIPTDTNMTPDNANCCRFFVAILLNRRCHQAGWRNVADLLTV